MSDKTKTNSEIFAEWFTGAADQGTEATETEPPTYPVVRDGGALPAERFTPSRDNREIFGEWFGSVYHSNCHF
jgi:hypothetical protein